MERWWLPTARGLPGEALGAGLVQAGQEEGEGTSHHSQLLLE